MDTWPQRENFKEAVRDYRTGKKVLLRDVAELLGIREQTLKDYLYRHDVKPSIDVLKKASEVFGVTVLQFVDDPGAAQTGNDLDERSRFMHRAMGADLANLTETEREAAYQVWKAAVSGFQARR